MLVTAFWGDLGLGFFGTLAMGDFVVEVFVGGDGEVGTGVGIRTVLGCFVGDAGIEVLVEGKLLDGCVVGLGETELTVESLTDGV